MNTFIRRDGKQLRYGYTTGTCAAAAAKAAAWMLLSGNTHSSVRILTPKGINLDLTIENIHIEDNAVSCAVRKDSGDDPDVTNGTLIYALVRKTKEAGILIDGGAGVGRVTKPGLDQPVGAAAINAVPRQMIRENLEEICELMDYRDGLSVIISVPDGERIAKRTFNSRLGILGGISILGTSGVVEPMSDQALIETIRLELHQRYLSGSKTALLTPGNYGMTFLHETLMVNPSLPVITSNFIGDALDICKELGFQNVLLAGHIGKLVKLAGGMLNTHSRYGDCRMEILASYAAACGVSQAYIKEILQCVTCDEALRYIKRCELDKAVLSLLSERISFHLNHRTGGQPQVEAILFSNVFGLLCETQKADSLLRKLREE